MKFLAKLFLALACLSVTACGGGEKDNTVKPQPPAPPASTPIDPVDPVGPPASGPTDPVDPVDPPQPPVPPASSAHAGIQCTGFYSADFSLDASQNNTAEPATGKPTVATRYVDPVYGTCHTRITDYAVDAPGRSFMRNDYSRRQAFNADSTLLFANSSNGSWHLYDAVKAAYIKVLPGVAGDAEPQWDSKDPNQLYFFANNGVTRKLYSLNVQTNTVTTLADWTTRLADRWPTAYSAWTKSEGSPSADRRYWCMQVEDSSWKSLGVFVWDKQTDTILGFLDTNGERPDHVSMSPGGKYCVVSGDGPSGTRAYSRDFSSYTQVHTKSEHSDLAILANGDDAYVSIDYQAAGGEIFMVNLRTGTRTDLMRTYFSGSATAVHFSGKSFARPGWVTVSTYADYGPSQWFHKKIFLLSLSTPLQTRQVAHMHNAGGDYFAEPHASANWDLTRIVYNTNWGVSGFNVDMYAVSIPPTSF